MSSIDAIPNLNNISPAQMVSNTNVRSGLESIDIRGSSYQVFSFFVSFSFIVGLSTILAAIIAIQTYDTEVTDTNLYTLSIIVIVFIALVAVAYITYLRNIGRYIYGRIRPISLTETECSKFKRSYSEKKSIITSRQDAISKINNMTEALKIGELAKEVSNTEINNPQLQRSVVNSLLKSADNLAKNKVT